MAWIKLDDQWMEHPKIVTVGRDARDVWLASITWCAKYLTDGYFPKNLLPTLATMAGVDVANCQTFASDLLGVCLWELEGNKYLVHDYLKYNPTKEQAIATREARKEAGKIGGENKASKSLAKSWQNGKQKASKSLPRTRLPSLARNPSPDPLPVPQESEAPATHSKLIQAIKNVTGRYPPKETWAPLTEKIADFVDTIDEYQLGVVYGDWIAHGYNKTNYAGMLDWYISGATSKQEAQNDKHTEVYRL
jgi:hypothetical protein